MPATIPDPRDAQAARAADFMERCPGSTAKEIDAACDLGSASKVLSVMPVMGYGIRKAWRPTPCAFGRAPRRRRVYFLTHRPEPARQLALGLDSE